MADSVDWHVIQDDELAAPYDAKIECISLPAKKVGVKCKTRDVIYMVPMSKVQVSSGTNVSLT